MISRVETMQQFWVSAVQAIQTGTSASYRSNVQAVYTTRQDIEKITDQLPSVAVLVGPTRLTNADTMAAAFNIEAQMFLIGYVSHDGSDALLHDLCRVVTSNMFTFLNDSNPWHVMVGRQPVIQCDWDWIEGEDLGWVGVAFSVQVSNVAQPL